MNEQIKTDFLRRRMVQLREINNCSITKMAELMHKDKSSLSRVEKKGGPTSFSKVKEVAREYCSIFKMSDVQIEMFLRGAKAVVVDTSALLKRPDLLDELSKEYSCVFVPSFVIEDLRNIKNQNTKNYGWTALQLLDKIKDLSDVIQTKNYSIPSSSDLVILDIAKALSEDMACEVDIVTYDVPLAIQIKGCIRDEKETKKDPPYNLLYLEEYAATKQNLINMSVLNAINEYYADSYEDIEEVLGITLPSNEDMDAYLADGITLIISAVDNVDVPVSQRIEKIRWLIKHGADINKRDCRRYNFPPLTHAIQKHDYELFSFLLNECKADPNVGSRNPYDVGKIRQKNDGNMPLMVAAWENQIDMVRDLCEHEKISLNQQDANGFTALIKACYWGHLECRDIILKAGADSSIIDHDGYSAEDRYDEFLRIGRSEDK